jgi:DAK2 domain fusion protein YloV
MTRLACDGPTLIRSVAAAVANLERHVGEVDALNVFPVPDGDTGSNMLATMRAALAEAEGLGPDERDLARVADALGRGALRGARGNSGVILAQIVRGMSDGVDGRRRATGAELAAGLRRGADSAYGSVVSPVEGTMLTVIRDTADAAASVAARDRRVETVLGVAIEAATRSVARTPTLLAVLAESGVVDSGGEGLLRLLEGTRQLDGHAPVASLPAPVLPVPAAVVASAGPPAHALGGHPGHYGFETVYFVESSDGTLDLDGLRRELGRVGESVVVAGDRSAARVHVHGAHPDLAIAIGERAGRLSDLAVADLDLGHEPPGDADRTVALITLAEADGLAALLASLGARVVRSGRELAEAVRDTDAAHAIVLVAGDEAAPDVSAIAGSAALGVRDAGSLIAAALAFDADASVDRNLERMADEAARIRTFAIHDDGALPEGALTGLRHHAMDGFELVTLLAGPGIGRAALDEVRAAIVSAWPDTTVDRVLAGQAHDALLVVLD